MKKLGNKIRRVLAADPDSFVVKLAYDDGAVVEVSLASMFLSPRGLAGEVTRGNLFGKCYVESGALVWPNGLALCPDALLMENATPRRRRAAPVRARG